MSPELTQADALRLAHRCRQQGFTAQTVRMDLPHRERAWHGRTHWTEPRPTWVVHVEAPFFEGVRYLRDRKDARWLEAEARHERQAA